MSQQVLGSRSWFVGQFSLLLDMDPVRSAKAFRRHPKRTSGGMFDNGARRVRIGVVHAPDADGLDPSMLGDGRH